ncbi:hypothetical protein BGX38DRAFT_1098221, partial [Terfezia claveryi]
SVEFTTIFVVRRAKNPVLFLEIKATGHIHQLSQRSAADLQMQDQFFYLFQIPIFNGLPALGPRVSVYRFNKSTNELDPAPIINTGTRLVDVAPADRWNIDIMSTEGEQQLRDIVGQVKAMWSEIR